MNRRLPTRTFWDQVRAFQRGVKPGVYEIFPGTFVGGKIQCDAERYSDWKWRKFFRQFNRLLAQYEYVHTERLIDNEANQSFYVYRENTYNLTAEKLRDVQRHHREIGLAVGIPEFAVEEFVRRKRPAELYGVEIRKLGLIFTMNRTNEDLRKLEKFVLTKGLSMKDVKVQ